MGIYNCASTLAESIESLLNQTYKDFELVLCDDGSSDETYQEAKKYADQYDNIILLRNETNRGLNYTLNRCAQVASGEYFARQDGDDLSLPERFEKEVAILAKHPEISLVSSAMIHLMSREILRLNEIRSIRNRKILSQDLLFVMHLV